MCTKWKRTANIILCSWLLSTKRAKHGHSLLVRGATLEYPAFTLIISILLAQIGTWRRVLSSLPKGAAHGHSLVTGAVFRPANQELQYYRSSEDAEFSKVPFSKQKTYCNVLLQKNGAWHGPSDSGLHAILSKLATQDRNWVNKLWNNFSWRETSEASNKGTCGAGETPLLKLHYQIRLSGYTAVCDDQPHPRSSVTDWRAQITSALLSLLASWTYKYPVVGCWEHETSFPAFLFYCSKFKDQCRHQDRAIWPTAKTSTAMMSLYGPCTESDLCKSYAFWCHSVPFQDAVNNMAARTKIVNISSYIFIITKPSLQFLICTTCSKACERMCLWYFVHWYQKHAMVQSSI